MNQILTPILIPIWNPIFNPKLNQILNGTKFWTKQERNIYIPKINLQRPYVSLCTIFSVWYLPSQCSSVPLPQSALPWILSKVDNLASYCLQPIHNDIWPQLNYQSSLTCIYECGTPSWACFLLINDHFNWFILIYILYALLDAWLLTEMSAERWWAHLLNTCIAAPTATPHSCKIQKKNQRDPKWQGGLVKGLPLGFGALPSTFGMNKFLIQALLLWETLTTEKEKQKKRENSGENSGPLTSLPIDLLNVDRLQCHCQNHL